MTEGDYILYEIRTVFRVRSDEVAIGVTREIDRMVNACSIEDGAGIETKLRKRTVAEIDWRRGTTL